MLGTMRLLLSGLVLFNHLWEPADNMIGYHAVAAFYITSGYLMMRVIHEVYGTDRAGVSAFLVNRALRILPGYWLFLALTLGVIVLAPPSFHYTSLLKVPATTSDWVANLFLVDLVWASAILVPPAWSLGIEALFYILMPLVLARTAATTAWWLGASLAITAAMIAVEAGFGYRYYPAYAASVFFAAGAMCFVMGDTLKRLVLPMPVVLIAALLFASSPLLARAAGFDPLWTGFYGAAVLYVLMLTTLVVSASPLGTRGRQLSRRSGVPCVPEPFSRGLPRQRLRVPERADAHDDVSDPQHRDDAGALGRLPACLRPASAAAEGAGAAGSVAGAAEADVDGGEGAGLGVEGVGAHLGGAVPLAAAAGRLVVAAAASTPVIAGLVPAIQLTAGTCARGEMDPGD